MLHYEASDLGTPAPAWYYTNCFVDLIGSFWVKIIGSCTLSPFFPSWRMGVNGIITRTYYELIWYITVSVQNPFRNRRMIQFTATTALQDFDPIIDLCRIGPYWDTQLHWNHQYSLHVSIVPANHPRWDQTGCQWPHPPGRSIRGIAHFVALRSFRMANKIAGFYIYLGRGSGLWHCRKENGCPVITTLA